LSSSRKKWHTGNIVFNVLTRRESLFVGNIRFQPFDVEIASQEAIAGGWALLPDEIAQGEVKKVNELKALYLFFIIKNKRRNEK